MIYQCACETNWLYLILSLLGIVILFGGLLYFSIKLNKKR